MKKTMFSALAVIAIVSAALAFAPAKQNPNIFTSNPDDSNNCNLITTFRVDPLGPVSLSGPFSTTALSTPCPSNTIQARVDN